MCIVPDILPALFHSILALAERDPRQAVAQAQQLHQQGGSDEKHAAWATYVLGWCWLRWERLPDARHWLQQAQTAWTLRSDPLPILHCRRALLMADTLGGAEASVQADWQLLVDDYTTLGHPLEAARTTIQQIEHLNTLVQPHDARALVAQIAPIIQTQGTPAEQAALQRAQASITSDLGDLEQAVMLMTSALDLFTAGDSPLEVARCLRRRSWLHQRREQFDAARDDVQQARTLCQQLDLPIELALCQRNAANIAAYLGEYARALADTYQARTALAALGLRAAVADCDLTLGNVAYYSAQYDLALGWYRQAQAVYTDLGSRYLALLTQHNQALVLRARGDTTEAFALLALLEAPMRALGDASGAAELTLLQGLTLFDMTDYDHALTYLVQAEARFAALENHAGAARAVFEQGFLALAQQQVEQAHACFSRARAVLAERPIHAWRIAYGLGRCAQLQGDPASALQLYQDASTIVAALRRTVASEHASSGLFALARPLFAAALALAAEQGDILTMVTLAEQQRALALQRHMTRVGWHLPPALHAEYTHQSDRLRQALAHDTNAPALDAALTDYMHLLLQTRHSTSHSLLLSDTAPDLAHLRAQFSSAYPAGWAVLLYARCGDQLFIITIDAETLRLEQIPCDATLYGLIERARLRTYNEYVYRDFARLTDPAAPSWQVPTALAERLIPADLHARLHPDLRLLIVPADPLHALPWAALRVGDAWLCEQAVVQLVPALALWETLNDRAAPGNDALLIGCSEFGTRAHPLPNMAAEQELVQQFWPGHCTCLSDAAATRQAVLELASQGALGQYGLLHITSHARLVDARGLLAHVKLWESDLLLDEVAGLGLEGALVVLAACDGAASEVLPGDEVLSLSHAFLSGGARDVIASVWAFFDLATHDLLTLLYTELAQQHDAPTALARAQRAFIAQFAHLGDHRPVEYSPVVWGGLVALGAGTSGRSTSGASLVAPLTV
jgi:tetratricopeptide (TPR) repeat protein